MSWVYNVLVNLALLLSNKRWWTLGHWLLYGLKETLVSYIFGFTIAPRLFIDRTTTTLSYDLSSLRSLGHSREQTSWHGGKFFDSCQFTHLNPPGFRCHHSLGSGFLFCFLFPVGSVLKETRLERRRENKRSRVSSEFPGESCQTRQTRRACESNLISRLMGMALYYSRWSCILLVSFKIDHSCVSQSTNTRFRLATKVSC